MPDCPRLSWSCYAAKRGIEEPELAAQLLRFVNPLPAEAFEALMASKGFDTTTLKHWILEEEVHALKGYLNDATAQLRRIECKRYREDKNMAKVKRVLNAFQDMVLAARQKGRGLVCWACREPVAKGRTCGECRIARYCSRTCQERDWETHRDLCYKGTQLRRDVIAAAAQALNGEW